ncbi:MAG: hypothetical protein DRI01_03695 [Chloroflexi bacterium]|nr:MAG: hypothetical protein DRI01_03695 [Chloroflexota bacterium]
MRHEDLIKKLENLKTPDIELTHHKQVLRMALLNSVRFKKRTIMDWARILAPVATAVLLIAVAGFFNVIQPKLQIAQAKEIAMNTPQVQEFMEEYGLEIKEVKLQNGEAFVLLSYQAASRKRDAGGDILTAPGEESFSASNVTVSGYILKINIAEEKVTGIGEINEDIDFKDIDFENLDLSEGVTPEEADLE